VLGQLGLHTPATVLGGDTQKDGLTWWTVSSTLTDGTAVQGWVADALTDGRILLSASKPSLPTPIEGSTFKPGVAATIVGSERVNVRRSPGYRGKPSTDVVGEASPGAALTVVQGPQDADGLRWWQVRSPDLDGWVAVAAPSGVRLLAPKSVSDDIRVGAPFQGTAPMTQGWGTNAGFYSQFKYDGVPLRGHNGLDFGTAMNTPLTAVDAGMVKRAGNDPTGFGNFILLQHDWGESLYAHLETVHVQRGQTVGAGAVIGLSGNTGASTGPHLHFSIRITPYRRTDGWGGFANPIPFMDLSRSVSFGPVEDREPSAIGEETLENPLP
jgi:murein DD-endopeptidase MepM/ murein hydrolase activator NlpD